MFKVKLNPITIIYRSNVEGRRGNGNHWNRRQRKKIQEKKDDRAVKGKKREDCVPERRSE